MCCYLLFTVYITSNTITSTLFVLLKWFLWHYIGKLRLVDTCWQSWRTSRLPESEAWSRPTWATLDRINANANFSRAHPRRSPPHLDMAIVGDMSIAISHVVAAARAICKARRWWMPLCLFYLLFDWRTTKVLLATYYSLKGKVSTVGMYCIYPVSARSQTHIITSSKRKKNLI